MLGCCLGLLGLTVSIIFLRHTAQHLCMGLGALAFIFFGLLPFTLVWTVIGTIWYCRITDISCVRSSQIPDDIRKSGILPSMLFANYIVSSLGGMFYCAGLYFCCKLRAQSISLLRQFSQHNYEMSMDVAYMPLEQYYVNQLTPCSQAETQGLTCTICYEDFEVSTSRPIKLPACNHIYHEGCIKDWFKLRSTCPYCRNEMRQAFRAN